MGRPIKRQLFNVPSTTHKGSPQDIAKNIIYIYICVCIYIYKRPKRNTGKKESKITEVKRTMQNTTENRTPKVEKPVEHSLKNKKNKGKNKKNHKKELHKVL